MSEVYEPVQLIVDNLVLQGVEANLVPTNAVSKAYVDSHISSAVSALVNAAPATLDTLKEIATALGNDANLASSLTNSIGAEATARIAADATLLADINKKVTDVGNWAGNLVHVEQVARIAGDADESKRAMAAESKEATDRATADAGLQSQITALSGSSASSVSSLQTQITAEVSARTSQDSTLRADFNEGDRMINERLDTLSMSLENETTDRSVVDMELSTKCENLVTSIFNEKAERKSEDVLIRASIVTVNEDLASESIERANADAGLQSQINALSGSSGSSVSSLQSQIETEVTARSGADTDLRAYVNSNHFAESNARITENGVIHQRISDEIIYREDAVYRVSDTLVQVSSALNMRCDGLDSSVAALGNNKFNISGGSLSGDVKLVDSYLNFGDSWRVKASGDGLRIVFEHLKNGVWRTALPFICSA